MRPANFLKRFSDTTDSIVCKIVFLLLAGMIAAITLQIVFRVFFQALTWTEELSRYLLVWSSFLGATLAYKRGMHISVTIFIDKLSGTSKKWAACFSIALSMTFFITATVYGFKLMSMQSIQLSAALRIPMKYVYLGMPVSFIIMAVHGLSEIFGQFTSMKGDDAL